MIIRELNLSNFRQFKDEEKIVFSTDNHSNITLILGINTSGKTTILQALLWCFYEKTNFKRNENLFNEQTALEMKKGDARPIVVQVKLEHSGVDYIIKREQYCEKVDNQVQLVGQSTLNISYKNKKGETGTVNTLSKRDEIVRQILPEDLSEYFFYDTERFGNITEKSDVKDAVKGLLGLKVLENALATLGKRSRSQTVIGRLFNELNYDGNKKLKKMQEEIEKAINDIEYIESEIKRVNEQISNYENKVDNAESHLRRLEPSMNLQIEIDKEKRFYEIKKQEFDKAKDEFQKTYHEGILGFLMSPLKTRALKFLEEAEVKDEGISNMTSKSIQDILDRGVCVCGTKVKNNPKAMDSLERALDFLPPKSLGLRISDYQKDLKLFVGNFRFYKYLIDKRKNLNRIELELEDFHDRIEDLRNRMSDIDEVKNFQKEVKHSNRKIKELNQIRDDLIQEKGSRKSTLDRLQNERNSLIKIDEKNAEIYHLLTYAEELAAWLQEDFDIRRDQITNKLEERVNYYFEKIYHGKRSVKIDSDYKVTLISTENNQEIITDESAGLETVKNFSFLAGLVDLAKKKLAGSKRDEGTEVIDFTGSEEYPLVLDAPFSNVDDEHVINISKVLPSVANQLVLIVMEKDWNYAANKLKTKVGKTYRLNKISEIYTKIEEV